MKKNILGALAIFVLTIVALLILDNASVDTPEAPLLVEDQNDTEIVTAN